MFVDLDFYWFSVGVVLISLAGFWGFRRLKTLFNK